MTIPDLLRRAAKLMSTLAAYSSCAMDDAEASISIGELRTLADRLEKPTEAMVNCLSRPGNTPPSHMEEIQQELIAAIAAAGEGL